MDYSYAATWLALISSLLGLLGFLGWWVLSSGDRPGASDFQGRVINGALPAFVVGLAAFCIMYTIMNPALQIGNFLSLSALGDLISEEARRGTLVLRIVSLLLGYQALKTAIRFILVVEAGFEAPEQTRPFKWCSSTRDSPPTKCES